MKGETPTTLVIFGATGDLAKSKLYVALYSMFKKGALPPRFKIIGFARSELSSLEFHELIAQSIGQRREDEKFFTLVQYQSGLFEDIAAYQKIEKILTDRDKKTKACSNKLFYLAVAPKYYKTILGNLSLSGLNIPCSDNDGWTRVLVEKPFGEDAQAARQLDEYLARLFREEQIFRIDHYLARETMQNIVSFRFSNAIFEPIWNNNYIAGVEIKLLEKGGVGERGAFYDEIGALRDVGQNHLLQMLALVAMGHPQRFEAGAIRRERGKILESLREFTDSEVQKYTTRGQYEGFRELLEVKRDSQTETYFKVKAFIDNARWNGVPFYLEGGKGLSENRVEINIHFKATSPCFCPPPHENHLHQNKLTFSVKPREEIVLRFWTKKPGVAFDLEPRRLAFEYKSGAVSETRAEAYEKVLFDCIEGEQMLFASSEEVAAAWQFIMPILRGWGKNKAPLVFYKKGSTSKEIGGATCR